jgi:hypothetical protein
MPDDRESNYAGMGWASQGAYPTVKRFNLGANITFNPTTMKKYFKVIFISM